MRGGFWLVYNMDQIVNSFLLQQVLDYGRGTCDAKSAAAKITQQ